MSTVLVDPVLPPALADPENRDLYEIIDGERKELPPMSAYAVLVACRLFQELAIFVHTSALGQPVAEMLFRLPVNGSRNRRTDVAFVSYARWPKDRPVPLRDNAWDVVPDVAVEVISPTDLAEEVLQKVVEYFQANVQLVWVVYPSQRLVYVYTSPTQVRILTPADELEGGAALPGFRLPVANLFPEAAPAS
jgi:Uma2 family endonuclease